MTGSNWRSNLAVAGGVIAGILLAIWFSTVVAMGPAPGGIGFGSMARQSQAEGRSPGDRAQERIQAPHASKTEAPEASRDLLNVAQTIATVVAAFGAVVAAWAAICTLRTMQDTARAQLKAYVAMGDAFMRFSTVNKQRSIEIVLQLKNGGQTPGYNFSTWCDRKIDIPTADPFTQAPPPGQRAGASIIGPRSSIDLPMSIIGIDDATVEDIVHGRKRIYAWGRCDYIDIYGADRHFEFKCWNETSFVDSRCNVSPHPQGYSAS